MTCFSHIIVYFIICRDFLSHRNRKNYTVSVSIYTVSARNYVLCAEITQKMQEILPSFLKKIASRNFPRPAVATVVTNITSGIDIMSYVSKDVRLGYEIGKLQGEGRNLNIIIQSSASCCCLGIF